MPFNPLDHLDRLVARPADIPRLNAAILQLAVRGRLVPQDASTDEPASELLKRIKAEKEQLVKEGKLKKEKPLPPVAENEVPYELPVGWVWTRLQEVYDVRDGTHDTPRYLATGVPFVTSKNLRDGKVDFLDVKFISLEDHQKFSERSKVEKDDILFAMIGSIGNPVIVGEEDFSIKNVALFKYYSQSLSYPKFLFYLLRFAEVEMKRIASGGVQSFVSLTFLRNFRVPLPPLNEQKRIVARVETLLARTQALAAELAQAEREAGELNRAALHHLLAAPTPADFGRRWFFVARNFDRLTVHPDHVAELKQAILQLAVRGRLVPQDASTDEPASQLLERIRAEKKKLLKEGKIIQKAKPVSQIKETEIPYSAPEGWIWVKLDELAQVIGGASKGRKFGKSKTVSLPYLRVANVQRGYLDLTVMKDLEIKVDEKEKYLLKEGDLLLTEGGDADKLGRSAIWSGEIPDCIHQNHIFRARLHLSEMSAEWLMLCTNSAYGRDYFLEASKQTTNLASINMTQLRNCPIPLPPLNEQKRIVARVDSLLKLCDDLAAELGEAETAREELLAAALGGVAAKRGPQAWAKGK